MVRTLFSKIKDWLIKLLGGYTRREYIDDLNKLSRGYMFYQEQVYDPVRVNYKHSVSAKEASIQKDVKLFMEYVEREVTDKVLNGLRDSDALTVTRTENKYGDIDVVASINVLIPREPDSNGQSL